MHLYLMGYRGSGKSTIAKMLSVRWSLPSVDCDDLIEQAAACSIREIFAREGEPGFRDREQEVIDQLSKKATLRPEIDLVVALGGGAILREQNRNRICETGHRVWLTASPLTLFQRIHGDHTSSDRRPALSSMSGYEEVVEVLAKREPLYSQVAQKTVDTESLSAEAICDTITDWVRSVEGLPSI